MVRIICMVRIQCMARIPMETLYKSVSGVRVKYRSVRLG